MIGLRPCDRRLRRPSVRLCVLASLLSYLLMLGLLAIGCLQPLDHWLYQVLFQARGAKPWDDRVVLVKIDETSLQQFGAFPWSRDRYTQLLNILARAQPNVVAFDLIFADRQLEDRAFAEAITQHQTVVLARAWATPDQSWQPTPRLASAAIAQGHILHAPDQDGQVRQLPTAIDHTTNLSLATLQTYRLFETAPPITALTPRLWLNWRGPVAQMPQYSFADVLNGKVDPQRFQRKIVLVGVTAQSYNPIATPFDQAPPASGVHLQATLLNNLLQQNPLHPLGNWAWWLLLGGGNLLWGLWLWRSCWPWQLLSLSGLLAGSWLIALGALHWGYWVPLALPIGLMLITMFLHCLLRNWQLEQHNRDLIALAHVDELTQVGNRRAFERQLQQEWQRALREQQPIALVLGDVDFFKQYNDYYGHLAGDRCLAQVAQILRQVSQRPTDFVARYGGEEFVLILPNTNLAGLENFTSRILTAIRIAAIPHQESDISYYLTLSLGGATIIPSPDLDWHDLIDAADRSLYQAKSLGRDQACHTATVRQARLTE
jgi:diguanylate cyclase (GGDEF)-like protein